MRRKGLALFGLLAVSCTDSSRIRLDLPSVEGARTAILGATSAETPIPDRVQIVDLEDNAAAFNLYPEGETSVRIDALLFRASSGELDLPLGSAPNVAPAGRAIPSETDFVQSTSLSGDTAGVWTDSPRPSWADDFRLPDSADPCQHFEVATALSVAVSPEANPSVRLFVPTGDGESVLVGNGVTVARVYVDGHFVPVVATPPRLASAHGGTRLSSGRFAIGTAGGELFEAELEDDQLRGTSLTKTATGTVIERVVGTAIDQLFVLTYVVTGMPAEAFDFLRFDGEQLEYLTTLASSGFDDVRLTHVADGEALASSRLETELAHYRDGELVREYAPAGGARQLGVIVTEIVPGLGLVAGGDNTLSRYESGEWVHFLDSEQVPLKVTGLVPLDDTFLALSRAGVSQYQASVGLCPLTDLAAGELFWGVQLDDTVILAGGQRQPERDVFVYFLRKLP